MPQSWQEQVNAIAVELDASYPGKGYGTGFLKYAAQHPGTDVTTLGKAYAITIALGNLKTNLPAAASATGTATGQIAIGAGKGAAQAAQDLFKGLNLGTWFIRIGEIVLGIVLIGVGIARITGAQNAISKVVKARI